MFKKLLKPLARFLLDAVERAALEKLLERLGKKNRISTAIRKPDQIIHPWQFGHPETKATLVTEDDDFAEMEQRRGGGGAFLAFLLVTAIVAALTLIAGFMVAALVSL